MSNENSNNTQDKQRKDSFDKDQQLSSAQNTNYNNLRDTSLIESKNSVDNNLAKSQGAAV